jgi:hypothetical protein
LGALGSRRVSNGGTTEGNKRTLLLLAAGLLLALASSRLSLLLRHIDGFWCESRQPIDPRKGMYGRCKSRETASSRPRPLPRPPARRSMTRRLVIGTGVPRAPEVAPRDCGCLAAISTTAQPHRTKSSDAIPIPIIAQPSATPSRCRWRWAERRVGGGRGPQCDK